MSGTFSRSEALSSLLLPADSCAGSRPAGAGSPSSGCAVKCSCPCVRALVVGGVGVLQHQESLWAAAALNFPFSLPSLHVPPSLPRVLASEERMRLPLLSACSTRESSREAATGLRGQQRKAETSLADRDLSDPRTCVPGPEERTLPKHELTGGDSPFANGTKALTRDCTLRRGVVQSCPDAHPTPTQPASSHPHPPPPCDLRSQTHIQLDYCMK